MADITIGPGVAERIVALDAEGRDRAEIAQWLHRSGLSPEQASALVAEVLEAEAMGEMAREDQHPAASPTARFARSAFRFVVAALCVLAASTLIAFIASQLPALFGWIGLYGIGLLFGRLVATVAGVVFALVGIVMAADGRDYGLMAGALAGAAVFYGLVLQWSGF